MLASRAVWTSVERRAAERSASGSWQEVNEEKRTRGEEKKLTDRAQKSRS